MQRDSHGRKSNKNAVKRPALPLFFNRNKQHIVQSVEPLTGGLTNENFLVRTHSNEYVLRIPGNGSAEYINREHESFNTSAAYATGATPEVVYDEQNGVKVTRYLEQAISLYPVALKRPENLLQAVHAIKRLHSADKFANDVNVFDEIRKLRHLLYAQQYTLPDKYHGITDKMTQIEERISEFQFDLVSCHNDTTPSNFIWSMGKMHLIDLEYSGNNDPVWDLTILAIEAELTNHECNFMLCAYYGDTLTDAIRQRFYLYQPVVEYMGALWCHLQIANQNQNGSPDALSTRAFRRFSRCLAALETHAFEQALNQHPSTEDEPDVTSRRRSSIFSCMRR